MNWRKFLALDGEPARQRISIPVKQYGISKVVFVRTRKNGGIKTIQIPVTAE